MSPRGDYEVADSIHYYRTGQQEALNHIQNLV